MASRKTLRGTARLVPGVARGRAGHARRAGRLGARSGSTSGVSASALPARDSLSQRNAKTTVMIVPSATIDQADDEADQEDDAPIARPTGQRLGPGTCGWSSARDQVASDEITRAGFRRGAAGMATMSDRDETLRRRTPQAILGPAPIDELAHLGAHLDLGRPLPRALVRDLRGGVDPELAADELAHGGVVEVVGGPVGEHDVARGVDVGADVEGDLRVVVRVDVRVDDDHRLGQRQQPEAPDRVHDLLRLAG